VSWKSARCSLITIPLTRKLAAVMGKKKHQLLRLAFASANDGTAGCGSGYCRSDYSPEMAMINVRTSQDVKTVMSEMGHGDDGYGPSNR